MEGYVQGRSGDKLDHNYRIPPDPRDARITELEIELKECASKRAGLLIRRKRDADEREQMLTRVRAMLMWVPKDDANRKWFEEQVI